MTVTLLGTEERRASAGETVWRVDYDGREAVIRHVHDDTRRVAWFTVALAGVGTVRVHKRDFTAAVAVARALLTGGAL